MGYSQLFAQGWTWGNLLAEGIGAFLFALLLIVGHRLVDNSKASPVGKKALLGGAILVIVLISALSSLGISELYRKSSGAPVLTPIFGLFYGFIIGSYDTVGVIIAAQIIGSLVGYLLGLTIRPRFKDKFVETVDNSVKGVFWRGFSIVFLLMSVAVISLINPTSYGGTAVLKIVIMALSIGGFVTIFGGAEFYSYVSFYDSIGIIVNARVVINYRGSDKSTKRVKEKKIWSYGYLAVLTNFESAKPNRLLQRSTNKNLQALVFQFVALGLLIGVYALVQSFPGSLKIANVI